jgi:hypothetical protein
MNKLYVVVRADITPGLQIAQSCHAVEQFHRDHPELAIWQNIVCLQVPDKEELAKIAYNASGRFASSLFREPDLQDEPTAIALEEGASKLLSCLPLALRQAA